MKYPVTTYQGLSQFYFKLIHHKIIMKVYKLKKERIVDFGCGLKEFSRMINNFYSKNNQKLTCFNYDINKEYSEIENIDHIKFDILVSTHVLQYMTENEIRNLFHKVKKINKECLFIFGIGKQNFLSKFLACISFNLTAHALTVSSYKQQIDIINKELLIIEITNVLLMTNILVCKFK